MANFIITSFGFKYGEPYPDADMRIDLRHRISNPQDHLPGGAVGTDSVVRKAVLGSAKNRRIFTSYLQRARKLAKHSTTVKVAFGCTSGIHRSVVFAEEMATELRELGHNVSLHHQHLRSDKGS